MLSDPQFHVFHHAPVLIVISGIRQGTYIAEDCALAAQNMMLAAFGQGLGTCWIGFSQGYLNTPEGKQALGIPETWMSVIARLSRSRNSGLISALKLGAGVCISSVPLPVPRR
jgi:hypothetical protein